MNQADVIGEIQDRYRQLGRTLNEFERRHWAAMEAMKLGRGGITAVSKALRMSANTIKRGIHEIATGQADSYSHANTRIRKPGGGRKSKANSLGRLSRTTSTYDSADNEAKYRATDVVDDNQPGASSIPTDLNSKAVSHNARDKSPNQSDIS